MHANHTTSAAGLPADALIMALQRLDEDAWIEREAALDLAHHTDPFAGSKQGDGRYWTQQPTQHPNY